MHLTKLCSLYFSKILYITCDHDSVGRAVAYKPQGWCNQVSLDKSLKPKPLVRIMHPTAIEARGLRKYQL